MGLMADGLAHLLCPKATHWIEMADKHFSVAVLTFFCAKPRIPLHPEALAFVSYEVALAQVLSTTLRAAEAAKQSRSCAVPLATSAYFSPDFGSV